MTPSSTIRVTPTACEIASMFALVCLVWSSLGNRLSTHPLCVCLIYIIFYYFFFIVFVVFLFVFFFIICMRLCGGTQISVAVWHLPVCQLSMIRAKQRTTDSGQWTTDSGHWTKGRKKSKAEKQMQRRMIMEACQLHKDTFLFFFCIYIYIRDDVVLLKRAICHQKQQQQ